MNNIGANKTVISKMFPLGKPDFKFFIGNKRAEKNRPLRIFRPQI